MSCSDLPSNRCGYTIGTAIAHETVPAVTCDRPTWDDPNYCIWHARETAKLTATFDGAILGLDEHIGGAHWSEGDSGVPAAGAADGK